MDWPYRQRDGWGAREGLQRRPNSPLHARLSIPLRRVSEAVLFA